MKVMKGLSMNKMLGKLQGRNTTADVSSSSSAPASQVITAPQVGVDGTPEEVVVRALRQFCESGGPASSTGDEVILLPSIVDASESSPGAAAEAARQLRKFLAKDNIHKPTRQYNAIMIIRILADNPGPTFTRNMDKKFVDTIKELLRSGRDPSVLQLTWETLDGFENTKAHDENLKPLVDMWKKEKERSGRAQHQRPPPVPRAPDAQPQGGQSQGQNYWARHHNTKRLPTAVELASRLEEARTSAKLLRQAVSCTPPQELLANELVREFADRCQSASRSIQTYMVAENPAPDNDTMEALIETSEELQSSLNQHQRAVLSSRKAMAIGEAGQNASPNAAVTRPSISQENPANEPSSNNDRETWGNKALPTVGADSAGLGIDFTSVGGGSNHSTPPPPVPARHREKQPEFMPPPGPPPKVRFSSDNPPAPQQDDPFKDPEERVGKQPARRDADEEDDGFYDTSPKPPRKDPGETMLRY